MTPVPPPTIADPPNTQTAELFAAERAVIDEAAVPLTWVRPSDHDPDRVEAIEAIVLDAGDAPEVDLPVGAGRVRGLLLHKLMEEVLTGELVEEVGRFANRARELGAELVLDPDERRRASGRRRDRGHRLAHLAAARDRGACASG